MKLGFGKERNREKLEKKNIELGFGYIMRASPLEIELDLELELECGKVGRIQRAAIWNRQLLLRSSN